MASQTKHSDQDKRDKFLSDIAKILKSYGMQCNCDLDNWQPNVDSGHSNVCRIDKAARAIVIRVGSE